MEKLLTVEIWHNMGWFEIRGDDAELILTKHRTVEGALNAVLKCIDQIHEAGEEERMRQEEDEHRERIASMLRNPLHTEQ